MLQRFGQFACALLFGLEQPHVLDSDGRLVSEDLDERDLLVGERFDFQKIDQNDAQQIIDFDYRHREDGPVRLDSFRPVRISRVGQNIGNVDRSTFKRSAGSPAVLAGTDRMLIEPLLHVFRNVEGRHRAQQLAIETESQRPHPFGPGQPR